MMARNRQAMSLNCTFDDRNRGGLEQASRYDAFPEDHDTSAGAEDGGEEANQLDAKATR